MPTAGQSLNTLDSINKTAITKSETNLSEFYADIRNEIEQQKLCGDNFQLMPDYRPARSSNKRNGTVVAYGANTH